MYLATNPPDCRSPPRSVDDRHSDLSHVLGVEPTERAVEPTRSQNMTVSWRRSADPESAKAAGQQCPCVPLLDASRRQFVTAFQAEFGTPRVRVAARRTTSEKSGTALQAEFASLRECRDFAANDDIARININPLTTRPLNRLSRIAQLDQRTALPDQCLHSAEADVRPPRRKSGFARNGPRRASVPD